MAVELAERVQTRPPAAYTVGEADLDRDRQGILAVWRRNLSDKEKAGEKFDWYYRSNPLGPGRIWKLVADESGEIVGTAGVGLRRLKVGSESLLVGLNSDFAVDKEHRSLLPAMRLQKAAQSRLQEGVALLHGVPNENAVALLHRIGYRSSGKIVRHARVMRSAGYLRRITSLKPVALLLGAPLDLIVRAISSETWTSWRGRTHREFTAFDERFDALWERARNRYAIATERTSGFLEWRYSQCPMHEYRIVGVLDSRQKTLFGYAVYYLDGPHARIADLIADGEAEMTRTIAAVITSVRSAGAESVSLSCGVGTHLEGPLSRFGFLQREGDGPTAQIVVGLGPAAARTWPPDAEHQWFFMAGDEDYS